MSDLSGRRGRVSGSEPVGNGRTRVTADVPQLELTRYAIELRSLSHGTATFTRSYSGTSRCPHSSRRRCRRTLRRSTERRSRAGRQSRQAGVPPGSRCRLAATTR
jgi:translation elongation factor EF-G